MQIERKEDGTPVQQFIWDKVSTSWGEFSGVEHISVADLFVLKGLIEAQLYEAFRCKHKGEQ